MANMQEVFDKIDQTRVELGNKLDTLTGAHAKTREEVAALSRGFSDHAKSEKIHPEQPCDTVKRLDRRLWGLVGLVLVALGKAAWDLFRGH